MELYYLFTFKFNRQKLITKTKEVLKNKTKLQTCNRRGFDGKRLAIAQV